MDAQVLKAQLDDAGVIALLGRITFAETFGYLFVDHQDDLQRRSVKRFHGLPDRLVVGKDR